MSLFTDVMEGYTGGYAADTQLDAATEADIDARISDEPFTVSEYTGECFYQMMACEAAMYAVEGRCSVNYMAAATESAKAETVAAMEASISGAWNKVKELASRAYEAVKKFIKKVWQKIKGFAASLRNAFKKFSESIDQSKLAGLKVKWQDISPEGAYIAAQKAVQVVVKKGLQAAVNGGFNFTELNKGVMDPFREELGMLIYKGNGTYDPKATDASQAIPTAIKIADLGFDKYFNNFLKLGEKSYKDAQNMIKKEMSDNSDKLSDLEDSTDVKSKAESKGLQIYQRTLRAALQVVQEGTKACKDAIQQMFSLAVKACRAAVRYSHGDKTATTKESYTNFDETLARIL